MLVMYWSPDRREVKTTLNQTLKEFSPLFCFLICNRYIVQFVEYNNNINILYSLYSTIIIYLNYSEGELILVR